ncbi:MAG: hypothetical protein ACLQIQ_02000 [Beijerinckiaceae bacterium]
MKEAKVSSISKVIRMSILGGLAVLGTGIFVAATGLVVAPQHAAATPAFAAKEGKACGFCHVKAAGGGALTGKGKDYQGNGHSFK